MEALAINHIDPPLDFSQPQQYLDVGNADLAYWKIGRGPDLILVHGWPLHAATYRQVVEQLKQHFTCHLFDLPGAGHTKTNAQTSYHFHATARSLVSVRKTLGIRKYGLIGHDSGGAVARFMADIDTNAVTALLLADTEIPHYHSKLIRLLVAMGKRPIRFELYARLLRYKLFRHSNLGFGGCFSDTRKIENDFFSLFAKPMFDNPNVLHGQRQVAASMSLKDINALQATHRRIKQPVLLLWGEQDPFFPVKKAWDMLADFDNGEMVVIEDGKLLIHEEFPDKFAEYARKFFIKI